MAAPTTLSFRADKDKDGNAKLDGNGRQVWKVFGPSGLFPPAGHGIVLVTKKDGTDTEVKIARVSKTFVIEGVECAYGYLEAE